MLQSVSMNIGVLYTTYAYAASIKCRAKITGRMGRQCGCYCAFSSSNILIHLNILNEHSNFDLKYTCYCCKNKLYIHISSYNTIEVFFSLRIANEAHSIANQFRSNFNLLVTKCLTIFLFCFSNFISSHFPKFHILISCDSILNYLIRSICKAHYQNYE